jgi:hypothetical protein
MGTVARGVFLRGARQRARPNIAPRQKPHQAGKSGADRLDLKAAHVAPISFAHKIYLAALTRAANYETAARLRIKNDGQK